MNEEDYEIPTVWEHADLSKLKIGVLYGHDDSVTCCKFFPPSKIVSSSEDGNVILWSTATLKPLLTIEAHPKHATSVACWGDNVIVTTSWDKTVKFWDMEKANEPLWTGRQADITTSCDVSEDGTMVLVGTDRERSAVVWDRRSGEQVKMIKGIHDKGVTKAKFSPVNQRIITTSRDHTCKFTDMRTGRATLTLRHHKNVIADCAITKDEHRFATASWDRSVAIWDIATGTFRSHGPVELDKGHAGCVNSCALSGDGKLMVSGGFDSTAVVWDVDNAVKKFHLQGHKGWVNHVAMRTDGQWVLTASKDRTIRLFDIENMEDIPMVLDNKISIGLNVFNCTDCGKPFSIAQTEFQEAADLQKCVFCRIQERAQRRSYVSSQ